jgi:PAS domain S-box-containing protein
MDREADELGRLANQALRQKTLDVSDAHGRGQRAEGAEAHRLNLDKGADSRLIFGVYAQRFGGFLVDYFRKWHAGRELQMKAVVATVKESQHASAGGPNWHRIWTSPILSRVRFQSPQIALRSVLAFCLFEAAYYFAYRYGMSFSQLSASPFWFPDSVLLCALLLNRPQTWWVFVLGAIPIRLFSPVSGGIALWFLATTSAIDMTKGLLAAAALRRFLRSPLRLDNVGDFSTYCLFAVLLVPATMAFAGAAARHHLGDSYWEAWQRWFLGNVLAHLVVTPAIIYWVLGLPEMIRVIRAKRLPEATALILGLGLSSYMAFNAGSGNVAISEPLFYMPVPFLFWAAIRFGMFGAAGASMMVACFAVEAALNGRGPFSRQTPAETALSLQHFLLLRTAPLYLVAILIEERNQTERSLRESEEKLTLAAAAAKLGLWSWDVTTDVFWATENACALLGLVGSESLTFQRVVKAQHPDDRKAANLALTRALEGADDYDTEFRVMQPDGEARWLGARGVVDFDKNRKPLRLRGVWIDLSARKQLEREAAQRSNQLAHMGRVAVLAELSGSLAHELNQPLSSILSNAQAAQRFLNREPPNVSEVGEILTDIVEQNRRAGGVIRQLRAMLKKKEATDFQPMDVSTLVEHVIRLMRNDLIARGISVRMELAASLPFVNADAVQIEQVLVNVILNACDAL